MMGPLPEPHTNSHKIAVDGTTMEVSSLVSQPETTHVVAHVDPFASVALTAAAAVAGVVAARKLRPLSHDAQARVDAGGDALVERRREWITESLRGW